MASTRKWPAVLTAVACAGSATLAAPTYAAASPEKTAAPCYALESYLVFFGEIKPSSGPTIDVRPTIKCREVAVSGGGISDYTIRLIGEHGEDTGKVLSTAVGSAWVTGDGNLHYTEARVIKGYPKSDWTL